MHLPDPVFPPLLAGHAVKAPQRPFEHACRRAEAGELGAADLVWSRDTGHTECAIILEPEVPLATALQMNALAQVAMTDCLGALLPPAVGVLHRWPGTILINGAAAGEVRLASPTTVMDAVPDWLVVGVSLRLIHDDRDGEPGELPGQTALGEECGGDLTRTDILQSFSAHFLTWLNTWNDDGFRPVHESWMSRAEAPMQVERHQERQMVNTLGLDEMGSLVIRGDPGPARALPLLDAIVVHRREPAR